MNRRITSEFCIFGTDVQQFVRDDSCFVLGVTHTDKQWHLRLTAHLTLYNSWLYVDTNRCLHISEKKSRLHALASAHMLMLTHKPYRYNTTTKGRAFSLRPDVATAFIYKGWGREEDCASLPQHDSWLLHPLSDARTSAQCVVQSI